MKLPFSFSLPTPATLARRELLEAQREKLAADSACDYASAISLYNAQRIDRLRDYLAMLREDEKYISKSGKIHPPQPRLTS
ncbi:MAG: hypothetical protein JZU60_02790 [Ilumatobacteraceae bacterium]|nr:hypothetical protein [Ilumatobacteraceae bacterium]